MTSVDRLPTPFYAACDHIAADLPGGRALFTTRIGGVSSGAYASLNLGLWTDDDRGCVLENRARVAAATGVPDVALAQGLQVHEARVRKVDDRAAATRAPEPADGQATTLTGVAPLVLVADCLPIALIAPEGVAMLHAGWRGLASGIIAEGVAALRELGAEGEIAAAIGPGIGPCCYEVGEEVHEALGTSGRTADLKAVARAQLEAAGVAEVYDCGLCTMCSDPALFFSHRRDRGITGRQAGLAWRT
jgi:YfiH family protein